MQKIQILAITTIAKKKSFLAQFQLILRSISSHLGGRVGEIGWLLETPKLKQGIDGSCISTESRQSKDVLVVVIDAAHQKLGIDCNNALVTNLVFTWVWYTYNCTPEDVVRLLSGLSINLLILL